MVINPIVGVYISSYKDSPIKGGMTIPNIRSLDPGTYRCMNSEIVDGDWSSRFGRFFLHLICDLCCQRTWDFRIELIVLSCAVEKTKPKIYSSRLGLRFPPPKCKIKHLITKNQQRQEKNTAGFSCLIYQLGCCVAILLWWQSECSAGGTCSRRSGTWGTRGTWRFAGPIDGPKADTVS